MRLIQSDPLQSDLLQDESEEQSLYDAMAVDES
jgi:hypothetical protein